LFIGTELFAYYLAQPNLLPWAEQQKPDAVFPYFIASALPVGVTGLVVAAIFAAAQSTLATSVNCCATLFLCDWYRRYLRPTAGERESLTVLRLSTIGFSCAGALVAIAMMRVRTAFDAWWELAGILSGGMLGLFLLGLVSRRVRGRAAPIGVLAGVGVIAWMSLSSGWSREWARFRSPLHAFLVVVVGTLTIMAVGVLAGMFSNASSRSTATRNAE
jgi:SSS family solute:Na+ symporter